MANKTLSPNTLSSWSSHRTERCLIAADIDKTILVQNDNERNEFFKRVAPELRQAASAGAKLAFITGNSMQEICNRFLFFTIEYLCMVENDLLLLNQFHFFCNSGGVYIHFPINDEFIANLSDSVVPNRLGLTGLVYDALTYEKKKGVRLVRPQFVHSEYLSRAKIGEKDALDIEAILKECIDDYYELLNRRKEGLEKNYDLSKIAEGQKLIHPFVDMRNVEYMDGEEECETTVQLTVKPVLSFRHGKTDKSKSKLFEKDLRTRLIYDIQRKLDNQGLGHYVARAGGISSIDVTLEKLDKAYALEFLIDYLNLQGSNRLGQEIGSNTIYFGDEVIVGGGNDYSVTKIPGILVFAVNSDRQLVPFSSRIFVPSSNKEGPEATAEVLSDFNRISSNRIDNLKRRRSSVNNKSRYKTSIDELKIQLFSDRIRRKISTMSFKKSASPHEWQALHTLVTLMSRDDLVAKQWLSILVSELDAIMSQVAEHPQIKPPAIGTSYDENL